MEPKITYFIGAGASSESLPLMNTMSERMEVFSSYLKQENRLGELKDADSFIQELDLVIDAVKQNNSIDVYAKNLALRNEIMALQRLKMILSSYLIFEQLKKQQNAISSTTNITQDIRTKIYTQLDKRYMTFWANYIKDTNLTTPSNVRVISWNYDMQFELSFSRISSNKIDSVQRQLQVFPSVIPSIKSNQFCILKLNGTAGPYTERGVQIRNLFDLHEHTSDSFNLNIMIDFFNKNNGRVYSNPIFSFAWEDNELAEKTRNTAKKIIQDTDVLVIIGYSFNPLNRDIDRMIFSNISSIKKVYFQAPKSNLSALIDRLNGVNPEFEQMRIRKIDDLSTFHIPNEYYSI